MEVMGGAEPWASGLVCVSEQFIHDLPAAFDEVEREKVVVVESEHGTVQPGAGDAVDAFNGEGSHPERFAERGGAFSRTDDFEVVGQRPVIGLSFDVAEELGLRMKDAAQSLNIAFVDAAKVVGNDGPNG